MPTPIRRLIVVLAAVALLVSPGVAPAAGSPADPQHLVDAYLASHPGGTQINATEIAYDGGRFVVTVARTIGTLGSPDCPSGWFCFYETVNYGYPRGKLSDCGWQDLGWWGWRNRTESVHYNLSTGSTTFIDETGDVDTALFTVSPTKRAIADVTPNRNKADYVYRSCS
jgi:hypothetical protein